MLHLLIYVATCIDTPLLLPQFQRTPVPTGQVPKWSLNGKEVGTRYSLSLSSSKWTSWPPGKTMKSEYQTGRYHPRRAREGSPQAASRQGQGTPHSASDVPVAANSLLDPSLRPQWIWGGTSSNPKTKQNIPNATPCTGSF